VLHFFHLIVASVTMELTRCDIQEQQCKKIETV